MIDISHIMKQKLGKSTILPARRLRKKIKYDDKNYAKTFINVECPYCSSDLAYLFWIRFDTVGYCSDCNVNWVEGGNGTIWRLQ